MPDPNDPESLLQEGVRLQQADRIEEAAALFRRVLEIQPEHPAAVLHLARAHEALGQWTRAVDQYAHLLGLQPDNLDIALARAEALRQAGCFHLAAAAYSALLEHRADSLFALAGLGETLRMLGRPADAITWFAKALHIHPEHAFALRGKAAALNALWRFDEALPYWDDALALDPSSTFARQGRTEAENELQKLKTDESRGDLAPGPTDPAPPLTGKRLQAAEKLGWARALVHDRRLEEAIDALEQATTLDPKNNDIAMQLGATLVSHGRFNDGAKVFLAVLKRDPGHLDAACRLGDALRDAERPTDAISAYDRALATDPENVRALVGRGEALRATGKIEDGIPWFERALARKPTHAVALRGLAASLNALGRFEEAATHWQRALDLEPGDESAQAGLRLCQAELRRKARQPEVPLPVSDRDETAARASARALFDTGRSLLHQGRTQEALEKLREAAAADGTWAAPWYVLGAALDDDNRPNEAISAFDQALQREPDHLDALVRKADAQRRHSDFAHAIETYDAVLALRESDARAWVGRAECLRLLGRFEEALDWFRRVLETGPDDVHALCGRASCLAALHRYEEALPLWNRAVALHPTHAFAAAGLAHCRAAMGEAPAVADTRLATRPTAPLALRTDRQAAEDEVDRGRSFHKDRNYREAIACYQRALALDPGFTAAAFRLGLAYEDDRQFRKAILGYERCLQLDPKHFKAATNIGECHRKNEQFDKGIEAYDKALAIKSDYLYALAGRAECMRMLGDYEACLGWFDKALAVGSRHAFAIQGKAAALNSLGRYQDAITLWDKALEIEPKSQFAKEHREQCQQHLDKQKEAASQSTTPTLDEQGRDLSALAKKGLLPTIVGRETEIRAVMKTLVRRLKANPLLLGDPGVGKTAVVEGVAMRLVRDDVPERLTGMRIIELSMGSLVAGTKYRGTFEERLKELIKEAKAHPEIVLFIDEIHTLVGAGRTEGGSLDAANILKPALARGEITVIGATTEAEYRKHFESDSALERRFQPIRIDEPTIDETIDLLRKVAHHYAEHHKVAIDDLALVRCAQMSKRYVPDRRLPDKALDLLDESCAEASLSGRERVTGRLVAEVVSERTGVPVQQLTEEERQRMNQLEDWLGERIVGQEAAIARLATAVRIARAGLRDANRPRGVFLLVGPSGVGKTELARCLADYLFPEGDALIKLDMSEYAERFSGSRLIGAPPGYSGHGDEGQLTGPLRRRPYAVVLLDEFEKAHTDVQGMFLSLFDEGVITDADGRKVHAKEAFFLITTNAGSEHASRGALGFSGKDPDEAEVALERIRPHFRPELLNRFDDMLFFTSLGDESLARIVEMHLSRLRDRAAAQDVHLSWTPDVLRLCVQRDRDPKFGARPALRAIEALVAEPLGQILMGQKSPRRVTARIQDGKVVFDETEALGPQVTGAEDEALA